MFNRLTHGFLGGCPVVPPSFLFRRKCLASSANTTSQWQAHVVRSGGAKQGSGDRDSVNRIEFVVHYLFKAIFQHGFSLLSAASGAKKRVSGGAKEF